MIDEQKVAAHFPIEVRFVKKDDLLLSPAHGHDVCFIGIIIYRPFGRDISKEKYWKGFEEIMYSLGGRPHWAKFFSLTPDQLKKVYPKFDDFMKIRAELDPTGMFANDYTNRHLPPPAQTRLLSKL